MKEHDEKGKKLYPFTAAACQVPACSAANSSQTVSPTMSDDEIATRPVVGITRNGNRAGGPIDSSMDGRHEFLPNLPNARQTDPTTGRWRMGREESHVSGGLNLFADTMYQYQFYHNGKHYLYVGAHRAMS